MVKGYRPLHLTDLTMHNVLDAVTDRKWLPALPSLRKLLITETVGLPQDALSAGGRMALTVADLVHLLPPCIQSFVCRSRPVFFLHLLMTGGPTPGRAWDAAQGQPSGAVHAHTER